MGKGQTRGNRDGPLDVEILRTGVLLSAHQARHRPAGADPLPVGVPSDVGVANAQGGAEAFARQDHVHNHPAGLGTGLHHAQVHGTGEHDGTVSKKRVVYINIRDDWNSYVDAAWDTKGNYFYLDMTKFDRVTKVEFICILYVSGGAAPVGHIDLWNATNGVEITGSHLSTGSVAWGNIVRSGDIKGDLIALTAEKLFTIRAYVTGGGAVVAGMIQLQITQSG